MKLAGREVVSGAFMTDLMRHDLDRKYMALEAACDKAAEKLGGYVIVERSHQSEAAYITVCRDDDDDFGVEFSIRNHGHHTNGTPDAIFWLSQFETWADLKSAVVAAVVEVL